MQEFLRLTQPQAAEFAEFAPIVTPGLVWLSEHPATWSDYDEFCRLKLWIDELQVTNDAAERAIKNAGEVADATNDPNHRENVVLVMNDHRGRISKLRKGDLNNV